MEIAAHLQSGLLSYDSAIQTILPALFILFALATLSGNYAIKCFFDGCGLNLQGRYFCGVVAFAAGLMLATGLSSCHATTAMIALAIYLSGMAMRGGAKKVATLNLGAAAAMAPAVLIS